MLTLAGCGHVTPLPAGSIPWSFRAFGECASLDLVRHRTDSPWRGASGECRCARTRLRPGRNLPAKGRGTKVFVEFRPVQSEWRNFDVIELLVSPARQSRICRDWESYLGSTLHRDDYRTIPETGGPGCITQGVRSTRSAVGRESRNSSSINRGFYRCPRLRSHRLRHKKPFSDPLQS